MDRYILLKDNRVIDTSKYNVVSKEYVLHDETCYSYYLNPISSKDTLIVTNSYEIVNQSNNVYDFLEEGDAVRFIPSNTMCIVDKTGFTKDFLNTSSEEKILYKENKETLSYDFMIKI